MEGLTLHTRPRHWITLASIALLLALTGACIPVSAKANRMTVFGCHTPNGEPAGHTDWRIQRTSDIGMVAADTCAPAAKGALHLELGTNPYGYGNLASIAWVFTAPRWATIAKYWMYIPDSYAYPSFGAGAGQAAVWASDESDPIYDYRNLGGQSWGAAIVERTPPDTVNDLWLYTSCDGQFGQCPAGATIAQMDVSAITLLLNDPTVPTVSNVAGSLVSGSTLTGMADASFDTTDKGPGIYSAWLVIDGKEQAHIPLDSNNGACRNLGQTADGTRAFTTPSPCAETVSASLTFDTSTLTDGHHTLKIDVDDASGNTLTAYNGTITTHNAPTVITPPSVSGTATVGALLTGTPGSFQAPEGAGALSAVSNAWLRCSDQAATHCTTITGATSTTYTPTTTDTGYYLAYQNSASDKDGTTIADSQPTLAVTDPSNLGGQSGGSANGSGSSNNGPGGVGGPGGAAASDGLTVNVTVSPQQGSKSTPWKVLLKIHPTRVHKNTIIKLTGIVSPSSQPPAGKIIILRARIVSTAWKGKGSSRYPVRRYTKWSTFMHLHADPAGHFTTTYKFTLARKHTYQFSALAPQEGNYLNPAGTSPIVTVYETAKGR
jgi:hypothetical protein